AGLFVIATALFDANFFRRRDLHAIDVTAVPDRLENRIAKTENQNVLHRLFPEIMIDAIDLILFKNLLNLPVQVLCRFQIAAERFLDHDASPVRFVLLRQADFAESLDNRRKVLRRGGEIKEVIPISLSFIVDLLDRFLNSRESLIVVEITGEVKETLLQPIPGSLFDLFRGEFIHVVAQPATKFSIVHLGAGYANHREVV